jgi:hypothetical protein
MAAESIEFPSEKAVEIWRNGRIPVLFKPTGKGPLLVRVPARSDGSYAWLEGKRRRKIQWNRDYKAWEMPRSRFNDIVLRGFYVYHAIYIIEEYREMIKCAPACWNAQGYECNCSCGGTNHGVGAELAHIVSDTFAFEWGGKRLSCRLLKAPAVRVTDSTAKGESGT